MKRLAAAAAAVSFALAIVACGGSDEHTGSSNAGTGGASATCPTGHICFDVKAVDTTVPIKPGHIVVMWYQINDDGPDPRPLIAYDKPIDSSASRVNIPIVEITPPSPELLFCDRSCNDESMCPCLSDPQIGFGTVLVVEDANHDGMLDDMEALAMYGIGWMALGYSDKPYMPSPPPILDVKFPEGIEQGVRPYRIIDEMGTFDNLGLSMDGDVFDLNVCPSPAATTCSVPQPNLT